MAERWLSGPVEGVPAPLQPVAHALLQARDDVAAVVGGLSPDAIWARQGASASIGFHAIHLAGATDRLFTYARGEALSDAQRKAAGDEARATGLDAAAIVARLDAAVEAALAQLRVTPVETLTAFRGVGRAQAPSTVLGLLFHAAEHASRHAGQVATLAKIGAGTPQG